MKVLLMLNGLVLCYRANGILRHKYYDVLDFVIRMATTPALLTWI